MARLIALEVHVEQSRFDRGGVKPRQPTWRKRLFHKLGILRDKDVLGKFTQPKISQLFK